MPISYVTSAATRVHPSTLQLLDELGLADRFAELPYSRVEEVAFPIGDDRQIVVADFRRLRVALSVRRHGAAVGPAQSARRRRREEPTFSLRMRTEMTELVQEGGRVRGVHYRTEDGVTGELRATMVVACDGRWSAARRQAGLRSTDFPVPIDAWWFRLPREPDDEPATLRPRAGPGGFAVVIPPRPLPPDRLHRTQGHRPAGAGPGIERFRAGRRRAHARVRRARVDTLASMDDVKHLDVPRRPACADGMPTGCCASVMRRTRCLRSEESASTWQCRTPWPRRPCSRIHCDGER
jgi:2-polyprenyl-6-methoxyphenol hydroxylase-like FAD-dependent oxidoreductase